MTQWFGTEHCNLHATSTWNHPLRNGVCPICERHQSNGGTFTPDHVKRRLRRIERIANDTQHHWGGDAEAHDREDTLHQLVLQTIADGRLAQTNIQHCTRLALSSRNIEFNRWYS